jgi:GNAT superfamily N-acetyltransferase
VSAAAAVDLRSPEPGDTDAMLDLVAACDETWREWTPPYWEPPPRESARWVTEIGATDRWTRVAVEPDGVLAGFVSWGPAREGAGWALVPGVAHLGALFVHPRAWRRGIASRLLDAAVTSMRQAGYTRARLNTPVRAPAERFYAAKGWRRDGGERWHATVGLPSVGYALDL